MATDFTIKEGDRLPELEATLYGANDEVAPLNGSTVTFILSDKATGTLLLNSPAVLVDADLGQVKYAWAIGDTDMAGSYRGEFEVTYGDGRRLTFPNDSYIDIKIVPDLDDDAP